MTAIAPSIDRQVPLNSAIESGVKGNLPVKADRVIITTFPGSPALQAGSFTTKIQSESQPHFGMGRSIPSSLGEEGSQRKR